MAAIGRVYNQAFDRSPAGTLAVTNGLLSGVADIVAQGSQIGLFVFLGSMGVMEGHSSGAIKQKYIDLYPPAIKANWTVWPVIQFVNFRFMPLPYRVPFQATCGVFWTLYLSLLNSSKPTMAKESGEDLVHDAKVAAKRLKDAEARAERAERR
ncbi:related to glomerulosclerosis protein Mpv17 [Serendipita indica DSM 11827]|uniref:Related to glomerulosclerosis protein Mpv17 n=1 Tax=Serendipita indica (strain DSM 11827) TaxID=1109443 RepID=G4TCV0_SERID|nr:related to glomerulosclerosis protein Mpv17 [Serendipita indica DSM 11827]